MKTACAAIAPFVTKDGSVIRELMHPSQHGTSTMSFAEATVAAGGATLMHLHRQSEEIYHVTQGVGKMRMGDAKFAIRCGDTIAIPPGTPHNVTNTGSEALRILCLCHPPYANDDTQLI